MGSTLAIAVHAGSRFRRNTEEDINKNIDEAGKEINGFFKSIWGGTCITNDQCLAAPYVAYCDKEAGVVGSIIGDLPVCRPSIWMWIIIAAIAFLLLLSCVCCLCCTCCSCILDCLCCCCRSSD